MGKRKTYKGKYKPIHPEKYIGDVDNIVFRSLWERKLMIKCDTNPNILYWGSEVVAIPYFSRVDSKQRRYFVDFIVKYRTKTGEIKTDLIEVKPYKETIEPKKTGGKNSKIRFINESLTWQRNQDKWQAARKFAKKHGMEFRIMTEYELGIKKKK
jgi:hypothetical protein